MTSNFNNSKIKMDENLSKILDLTRYLTELKATFYLNIRTKNGLKFEIEARPRNTAQSCPGKSGEQKKNIWKTPAQIAQDKKRLQAFRERKISTKENLQTNTNALEEEEELGEKEDECKEDMEGEEEEETDGERKEE